MRPRTTKHTPKTFYVNANAHQKNRDDAEVPTNSGFPPRRDKIIFVRKQTPRARAAHAFMRAVPPTARNSSLENNFASEAYADPLTGVFGRKSHESVASDSRPAVLRRARALPPQPSSAKLSRDFGWCARARATIRVRDVFAADR
jgi:hypothetical protein